MKQNLIHPHGQAFAALRKCLILFALLLSVAISARAAIGDTFTVGDLKYYVEVELDEEFESIYEVGVSGYISKPVHAVIPDVVVHNGKKYVVTDIKEYAFSGCRSLTSVTIPNTVTSIGNDAFGFCTSLTSVHIPQSVVYIGIAFSNCVSLGGIYVDSNNPNYHSDENGILYDKNWTTLLMCPGAKKEVTIPDFVTRIGNNAFEYCQSLTSVNIPNSVTSIGAKAFSGCIGLTSITIPESVTSIEMATFSYCYSLASVDIPNSVKTIEESTFQYCRSLASINIPSSLTSIGEAAFEFCEALQPITIPNSVISIGGRAFRGCMSLVSITIPASVTNIGSGPFAECYSLEEILVASDNPNYCSKNGILYDKEQTVLIQCPTLKEELNIPNTVTSIENYACDGCSLLISVNFPSSVTKIGAWAFAVCMSLESITLPESMTSIGAYAFEMCQKLKTIYSASLIPPGAGENTFGKVPADAVIYVPAGAIEAYSEARGWKYFWDFREMSSGVSELPAGCKARPADVYNMQGALVKAGASQDDINALAPGLYIIGGRKILVK